MNKEEFNLLLAKYYEGETTSEEEKFLDNYLKHHPSDDVFDQNWFKYINEARQEDQFSLNGEELLENALNNQSRRLKAKRRKHVRLYTFIGIAAGIAILMSLFIFPFSIKEKSEITQMEQYNIESPDAAYVEAKNTLLKISEGLNRGTNQLAKMDKLNEETEKLDKVILFNVGIVQLTKFQHIEKQN